VGVAPVYEIESIQVRGNSKTRRQVIVRELTVQAGDRLSAEDARFRLSRFNLLALGLFSEVRLRLERGSQRGQVVLVVEVVERGTILLTDLFLGTSEATSAWGGLGVAERNFLGRAITLQGAFVLGADPDVDRGQLQQAYWVDLSIPRVARTHLELDTSLLYLDGSEFFRRSGPSDSSDPDDFLSILYRRVGATLGAGIDIGRYMSLHLGYRGEAVRADVPLGAVRTRPGGSVEPIEFGIRDGNSVLSLVSVSIEHDTRSDPIVPERGWLLTIGADASTRLLGSDYTYFKLRAGYRHFFPLPWGHVFALDLFGGVVFGDAPFFERFFIGDFNDLVPGRALGLNFSTLPSRDIFGTSIDDKRYEEIALRTSVEYVVPWFRGGKLFYSGDFFLNVGVIFLASKDDLRARDVSLGQAVPLDLTLDAGLRLDTRIGIFRLSVGNALGRIPF